MEFVDALRLAQRTREIIIQNLPRPLAVDINAWHETRGEPSPPPLAVLRIQRQLAETGQLSYGVPGFENSVSSIRTLCSTLLMAIV